VIESIPNVSEGRRAAVVDRLADTLRASPGVRLLDSSSDWSHNRAVFSVAGEAPPLERALLSLVALACDLIDLRRHRGVHPRIGAVDVVPLVPLTGATMTDCVALARRLGATVGERFGIPVFLYEEAASTPERRRLDVLRRGEFEGLSRRLSEPAWAPDFGPASPHPRAGAMAIGARRALIAFNVNLASDRLDIAKRIAARVRERDGGLPAVKALGLSLPERRIVQVSMNLTDFARTSPRDAFEAVQREAAAAGVAVLESELVGLIPQAALNGTTPEALQLTDFSEDRILEVQLARMF
jgi:glutamate formiminotransferase